MPPLRRIEPDVTASVQIKGEVGLKLYTIFIDNVSFLKVRFGGQKWGGGGGGGGGGERSNKGKERRKKKERGEEKKAMVALLVFIMATWRVFDRRELLDEKGPFGYDVFKNPAT